MSDFPTTIQKPDKALFKQTFVKSQILHKFESGSSQSRGKHTKGRWRFVIGWNLLTETDFDSLIDHFSDNVGGSFNWVHPITGTAFTVKYLDSEIKNVTQTGWMDGEQTYKITGINLGEP